MWKLRASRRIKALAAVRRRADGKQVQALAQFGEMRVEGEKQ